MRSWRRRSTASLVTLFILISNPVTIAVLVVAVLLARADVADYLALTWPPARHVDDGDRSASSS